LANQQRYLQPAFGLINGSVGWTDQSGRYTVTLWGNNLTDQKYRLSYSGSTYGDYGAWAWPRQLGIRGSISF
jgi:iron complex outermembrane receptor protein